MSELRSGAIFNYISLFFRMGVGFFLAPFVLLHLGRSEYGVYAVAGTIVGWLAMSDFGLTISTTKFISEYQARGDAEGEAHYLGNVAALFTCIGAIVLILGLCIFPFIEDIFPRFNDEELHIYRVLYLMTLANTVFMFPARSLCGISSARQKFKIPSVVALITSILTVAGTVIILLLGYKSIVLTAFSIILGIFGLVWNVYYCFSILKARITWRGWDIPLCKGLFAFSFWIFLDNVITLCNWGMGNMIIGMTCGAAEIAVYSYGLAIMQYYNSYAGCITSLFLPGVVKQVTLGASNEQLTSSFIVNGRRQFCILMLPVFLLIFFGLPFFHLWIGESLHDDVYTTWYITLLLVGSFTIPAIQNLGWQILQAKNAIRSRVKVMIFIAGVNLMLGYTLSRWYGPIGLAVGTSISVILGQGLFMNWLYAYRIGLNVRRFWVEVMSGAPVAVLLYAFVGIPCHLLLSRWMDWWNLIGLGLIFSLLYLIITYKVYMKPSERDICPECIRELLD